ncbi:hypothetical protein Tco_1556211 [Tanacetum coccineum]
MWSPVPIFYDKHTLWGISYWRRKRQEFYGFVVNRESAHDVYSRHRIIIVTILQIIKWHNYKHLDWITVSRDDDKLDGTLNDVWYALDDILKQIQMNYLPYTVWRNVDKERTRAMIHAIDR